MDQKEIDPWKDFEGFKIDTVEYILIYEKSVTNIVFDSLPIITSDTLGFYKNFHVSTKGNSLLINALHPIAESYHVKVRANNKFYELSLDYIKEPKVLFDLRERNE